MKIELVRVVFFCSYFISLQLFSAQSSQLQVPNISFLGRGYDALKGQPVSDSLRLPIVQLTNPSGFLPNQIYVIPFFDTDTDNHVQIFTSLPQLQRSMTKSMRGPRFSQEKFGQNETNSHFIQGMFSHSNQAISIQ
jgi:hypothetical protein